MKKVLSILLSIVLVLSSVAALTIQAFAATGDTIGQYDFTISNPYETIDWDKWLSILHISDPTRRN